MTVLRVLGWFLDPHAREEVLGDFVELRGTRSLAAVAWDLLSVVVRTQRARQSGSLAAILTLTIATTLAHPARPARAERTVIARDPAGTFALVFSGPHVVGASLDGVPVPSERLVQTADRLLIRGGDGDHDLAIELRPDGSFRWRGRSPRLSTP